MSTTQELMQASMDLRERRISKHAALVKQAADDNDPATDPDVFGETDPSDPDFNAGEPQSAIISALSKVPPEAWGALLGLGAGAGIGGAIKGGKGALIGGGIGAGVGAGAGYGYRRRDDIAELAGKTVKKGKELYGKATGKGKELYGKGKEKVGEAADATVDELQAIRANLDKASPAARAEIARLLGIGQQAAK